MAVSLGAGLRRLGKGALHGMSKKTKAEKHSRRVQPKTRRGAHRRHGRLNPALMLSPERLAELMAETPENRMLRGLCKIFEGLIEIGVIPEMVLDHPEMLVAPERVKPGEPL